MHGGGGRLGDRLDILGPLSVLLVLAEGLDTKGSNADELAKETGTGELAISLGQETVADVGADKHDEDEADGCNSENPVQVLRVDPGIVDGVSVVEQVVVDGGEEKTTADTGNSPGSENDSVKGSNVGGSEHVAKEGRDGSETTSVAGSQDPNEGQEGGIVLDGHDGGERGENDDLKGQHDNVAVLAAQKVRCSREEETTSQVKTTVDGDDGGGGVAVLAKDIGDNVRETREEDETGNGVTKEHEIDEAVLAREDRVDQGKRGGRVADVTGGLVGVEGLDVSVGVNLVAVHVHAVDLEAGRGDTEDQAAEEHDSKVGESQGHKGLCQSNGRGEREWDLGEGDRTSTKSTDGKTGSDTAAVREPLLKSRDWTDIAKTESRASNHTISKVDKTNKLFERKSERIRMYRKKGV